MLTEEMTSLIRNFSAGSVATVSADGTPTVSPKATFIVLDNATLAFANLRSPGTIANVRRNPAIEVCFTDIVTRRAVRVTGMARTIQKRDAPPEMLAQFEAGGDYLAPYMSVFVVVNVTAAELIMSPAYDRGMTEKELKNTNLTHLNAL